MGHDHKYQEPYRNGHHNNSDYQEGTILLLRSRHEHVYGLGWVLGGLDWVNFEIVHDGRLRFRRLYLRNTYNPALNDGLLNVGRFYGGALYYLQLPGSRCGGGWGWTIQRRRRSYWPNWRRERWSGRFDKTQFFTCPADDSFLVSSLEPLKCIDDGPHRFKIVSWLGHVNPRG